MDIAKEDPKIRSYLEEAAFGRTSHGQTDEGSLLPYAVLDPIVMAYVEDYVTTLSAFVSGYQNREI